MSNWLFSCAACCGILRVAACCSENDITCRAAPRSTGSGMDAASLWRGTDTAINSNIGNHLAHCFYLIFSDFVSYCLTLSFPPITCLIMAALRSRCGHYIFALWFIMAALWNMAGHYIFAQWFLSSIFFPRLISTIRDWMSTILPHMVLP